MRQHNYICRSIVGPGFLALLLVAVVLQAGIALGQDHTQRSAQEMALRQEVRDNIRQHPGLDNGQQEQMMANLDRCLDRGLRDDQIRALFPDRDHQNNDRIATMLSMQDRILTVAEADLPIGPMMDKLREGQMKDVRPEMLDRALEQTGHNIRVSHRVMTETVAGGVRLSGYDGETEAAVSDLSRCLWDGLQEQDMEYLGDRARMHAREADYGLDEFVAANQSAARFAQSGMDRRRAVEMAGEAMHNGYTAREMRTMGEMMASGAGHDSSHDDGHQEMMDNMYKWVHEGMSMDEMTRYMMEGGWMGPADMMGPGGHHPMNDMGWGGAGHDGGMGGDHGHGGMDGDHH